MVTSSFIVNMSLMLFWQLCVAQIFLFYLGFHKCLVILIAGIFPRASSNGAHGSQSDDSTYLVSDMRCSLYLTLDQQVVFSVARITGVANLPPKDVV